MSTRGGGEKGDAVGSLSHYQRPVEILALCPLCEALKASRGRGVLAELLLLGHEVVARIGQALNQDAGLDVVGRA